MLIIWKLPFSILKRTTKILNFLDIAYIVFNSGYVGVCEKFECKWWLVHSLTFIVYVFNLERQLFSERKITSKCDDRETNRA